MVMITTAMCNEMYNEMYNDEATATEEGGCAVLAGVRPYLRNVDV